MGDYLIQVIAGLTVAALVALASAVGRWLGKRVQRGKSEQYAIIHQQGDGNTVNTGPQVSVYFDQQIKNTPGGNSTKEGGDPFGELVIAAVVSVLVFVLVVGLFPILLGLSWVLTATAAIAGAYLYFATRHEGGVNVRNCYYSTVVTAGTVLTAIVALVVLPHRGPGGDSAGMSLLDIAREVGLPTGFSGQGLSVTLSGYLDYVENSWAVIFGAEPGYYVYVVAVLISVVVLLFSSLGVVLDWGSYVIVSARQARGVAPSPNTFVTRRAGRFLGGINGGRRVIGVVIVAILVLGAVFGLWEYLFLVVSEWASR